MPDRADGARTPLRLAVRVLVALVLTAFALAATAAVAPAVRAQEPPSVGDVVDDGPLGDLPDADTGPAGPAPGVVDTAPLEVPGVPEIDFGEEADGLSRTVAIVLAIGLASMAPALVLLTTTFTRFIVVLSLVKNALALQTVPPSQVLVGLALFLTAFTMGPTLSQVNDVAIQPLLAGEIEQGQAWEDGFEPLRAFMLAQVRDDDLELFVDLAGQQEQVESREDVPALTLIPAFVISELRTAFTIGFVVFVPFLLIDLVVAAVLMSMGMVMVPPVFISLPLKLLLFVLVDGWVLMIGSLVQSINPVGVT